MRQNSRGGCGWGLGPRTGSSVFTTLSLWVLAICTRRPECTFSEPTRKARWSVSVIPRLGIWGSVALGTEKRIPRHHWAANLAESVSSRFSEKSCFFLKKKSQNNGRGKGLIQTDPWLTHARIAVSSRIDEHMYPHIHVGKTKRSKTDEIFAHHRSLVNAHWKRDSFQNYSQKVYRKNYSEMNQMHKN